MKYKIEFRVVRLIGHDRRPVKAFDTYQEAEEHLVSLYVGSNVQVLAIDKVWTNNGVK